MERKDRINGFFCAVCGWLDADENGSPIHPEQDKLLAERLKNGFTTEYTN